MYAQNPNLQNKSSDDQMEFIRWHALSSYVRWIKLLKKRDMQCIEFLLNIPELSYAWSKENDFSTKTKNPTLEVGHERILRFKPDIVFCFDPINYFKNNFLNELMNSFRRKPKLIAWYGANNGKEDFFNFFDLTLSNSKFLVNKLKSKALKADFLQHAFDPIILEKVQIPSKRKNKVAFFGNLDATSHDFEERNLFLKKLSNKNKSIDIFGQIHKPELKERAKFYALEKRHNLSQNISSFIKHKRIKEWADPLKLPTSPWLLPKEFVRGVKKPLFGHAMLEKLATFNIALNFHNKHTGDHACNMRLFEATGIGCALVTDKKSDLSEYFLEQKEVFSFDNVDEALEIITYLLENKDLRENVAKSGQKRTLKEHNTNNQIKQLCVHIHNLKY